MVRGVRVLVRGGSTEGVAHDHADTGAVPTLRVEAGVGEGFPGGDQRAG
jgi:hypothetical protein